MNFYEILEVDKSATKQDIKKAYHKLAVLYHPDKNKDPETINKFRDINTAYSIISDDGKRREYDYMTGDKKMELYDLINTYFSELRPEYNNMYETFLKYVYNENFNDFRNDINNFKIYDIFDKFVNVLYTNKKNNDIPIYVSELSRDLDIRVFIYTTLQEKYNNVTKTVYINDKKFIVPMRENEIIFFGEGEKNNNGVRAGSLLIKILCDDDPNFQRISKYDLLYIKEISLSEYLYGSTITILDVNNEILNYTFDNLINQSPIITFYNKGLPKDDNGNRGDLFVFISIHGVNSILNSETDVKYADITKETVKLLFPAL